MSLSLQSASRRVEFEPADSSQKLPDAVTDGLALRKPQLLSLTASASPGLSDVSSQELQPQAIVTDRRQINLGKLGSIALQFTIFPISIFALWWFVSSNEILSSNILPSPFTVAQSFLDLLSSGELADHLGISLWRVAKGSAIGLPLGFLLGVALGVSPSFESWIGPSFRVLVQIPSIVLIPLFMMLLGIDDSLKLFIMAKACVIPLALVTSDGIRNIPKSYIEVSRALMLSRKTTFWRVVIPGAMPTIFTGVRQGIAHVWVALVGVEVLASADGIGYLMTWSRQLFQLDVVLVCVAVIGAIGFALDFSLRKTEAHLLRWRVKSA